MKTIEDLRLDGRRVLARVDFNVPLEGGRILDDRRICAALPTIRYARDAGASLVLMSHLGRPGGAVRPELSLAPVADRLRELLGPGDGEVRACPQVVGPRAREMAAALDAGDVLVLENLRFEAGEKDGDAQFAAELADLGDLYVNDAFATCHREHASMVAVPRRFGRDDRAVGLLVAREVETLDRVLDAPKTPFVAVLGGAKVADKIGVVRALLDRVDHALIGGALAYTFLVARGADVGASPVEEDALDLARDVLEQLEQAGDRLSLPEDHRVGRADAPDADVQTVAGDIPAGLAGYDIGPRTVERYRRIIGDARTVVWNGPLGLFERDAFAAGTRAVADAVAREGLTSVVGGGETADAVARAGRSGAVSHLSTGGGAFLTYLERRTLPALEVLDEA